MSRGTLTSSARFRKPKSQGLSIWPKPMQSVTGFVGSVSAGPPASASPSLISSHRASCRQSSWCSSYMYTCIHVYIYIYIYIYTQIYIYIYTSWVVATRSQRRRWARRFSCRASISPSPPDQPGRSSSSYILYFKLITCTHIYICAYIYICIYIYTHIQLIVYHIHSASPISSARRISRFGSSPNRRCDRQQR